MNFAKAHPRMALFGPIIEAMVNGHSDTPILVVLRVSPNQHGFVVVEKMTPANTTYS